MRKIDLSLIKRSGDLENQILKTLAVDFSSYFFDSIYPKIDLENDEDFLLKIDWKKEFKEFIQVYKYEHHTGAYIRYAIYQGYQPFWMLFIDKVAEIIDDDSLLEIKLSLKKYYGTEFDLINDPIYSIKSNTGPGFVYSYYLIRT